ncbi:glycosyltransferase family 2 protein [Oceanirhabdus sp. W0125-5]|uniref:glycosyltransferase family 2 protein n=1 Tax=Oceanirhabdus sp. W0125-5 TaxID=2999116 RepID=UPI0022F2C71C|nr:glycosyltransferase family 2 protein [Oceanirhabdus sp. W0125-5]WBW98610.1 glycosyltransferase family 2 protein [Oceanirhabdus sp. W0125-5]
MKISIIVPVYNVELYLRKCVDSILNQTIENLEIILVNDGSKDRSGAICDEYKKKDHRVIVIHKENGGLSSARNAGINVATGELIGFIDSDDWIEPDYYEILYDGIIKNNADISVMHLTKVTNHEKIEFETMGKKEWVNFTRHNAMERFFGDNFIGYSACNKLYRRKLFEGIRYPEGMIMEDKATTYKLIHKANSVVVNLSCKYHYYLRNDSIMQSNFNRKKFDSLEIHIEQIEFVDRYYPEFKGLIRGRFAYEAFRLLLMMIKSNYSEKSDFNRCQKIIKDNIRYVMKEKRMGVHHKIYILIAYLFPYAPFILAKSKLSSKILKKMKIA